MFYSLSHCWIVGQGLGNQPFLMTIKFYIVLNIIQKKEFCFAHKKQSANKQTSKKSGFTMMLHWIR